MAKAYEDFHKRTHQGTADQVARGDSARSDERTHALLVDLIFEVKTLRRAIEKRLEAPTAAEREAVAFSNQNRLLNEFYEGLRSAREESTPVDAKSDQGGD